MYKVTYYNALNRADSVLTVKDRDEAQAHHPFCRVKGRQKGIKEFFSLPLSVISLRSLCR
ncbi:MAG: hypothetical protein K6G32_07720 [Prevotella sp.]|nr:hypothetical protein [Prevotella sp.]